MKNIFGNNASPLRGDAGLITHIPTLRIGLICVAPAEPGLRGLCWLILIAMFSLSITACSTRVEYMPTNTIVAAPTAININTATAEELEKLPHIGRKTAENIVQFRTENGPFRRTEHLLQIRGISEKRFLELRQYLRTE